MDKFLVHKKLTDGRAMHALVIGVGYYPHLLGGKSHITPSHDGMRATLTSPPISARYMADWLISEFSHSDYLDSTVSLLLTEKEESVNFTNKETGSTYPIEPATCSNIEKAIKLWRDRGNINADDLLLFYFCGHGISEGNAMVILPSDFGTNIDNAYEHAIDFGKLHHAMKQYKARTQCYFIDACRSSSDTLKDNNAKQIFQIRPRKENDVFTAPVYYSSLKGAGAFGKTNKASIYTSALLQCLNNYAAVDDEGDWRVSSFTLARALDHMMRREKEKGAKLIQTPITVDNYEEFYLHYLNSTPKANIYVTSNPKTELTKAELSCNASGQLLGKRAPGFEEEWAITVPTGEVEVIAKITNETSPRPPKKVFARPLFKRVTLDLS